VRPRTPDSKKTALVIRRHIHTLKSLLFLYSKNKSDPKPSRQNKKINLQYEQSQFQINELPSYDESLELR
jgi:hypothetical protein